MASQQLASFAVILTSRFPYRFHCNLAKGYRVPDDVNRALPNSTRGKRHFVPSSLKRVRIVFNDLTENSPQEVGVQIQHSASNAWTQHSLGVTPRGAVNHLVFLECVCREPMRETDAQVCRPATRDRIPDASPNFERGGGWAIPQSRRWSRLKRLAEVLASSGNACKHTR
jgi:hypothetical protein